MKGLQLDNRDDAAATESLFDALGLPLPEGEEFFRTHDSGRVVFLTEFGCTIRFTKRNRTVPFTHPRFLKPLFARAAGNYNVTVNPGIVTPVKDESEAVALQDLLKRSGIVWSYRDCKRHNAGYIPGTAYTVILDLDDKYVYATDQYSAGADLPANTEPDPQGPLYAPLRTILTQAWPETADRPEAVGVRDFWRECASFKKQGKLVALWENPIYNRYGTTRCAANYMARIRQSAAGALCL